MVTVALAPVVAHADSNDEKFPANQLTLDGFGTYHQTFPTFGSQFDRNWKHGNFGGGVGLNYFFVPYLGLGVDTYSEDHGAFFKNVAGSLILRMPVAQSGFAPYIFGGVGGTFDPVNEWTEHAGLGVEYRFSRHIGLFGDWRYTFEEKEPNSNLVRVGVRFGL
jgi:hypothetical protein